MSLVVIKAIMRFAIELPAESFDILYANGYYNFGILRVENLSDLSDMTMNEVLSAAFIGGFLPLLLAIFIPMFICGSHKSGFIRYGYVSGLMSASDNVSIYHKKIKSQIFLSYTMAICEFFFIAFCTYIVSLLLFSYIILGLRVDMTSLWFVATLVARQLFAHFVFITICISSSFIYKKTSITILSLIFSLIAFPSFLWTLDLILGIPFKFASLWIVNIIEFWSYPVVENMLYNAVVATLTLVLSIVLGWVIFLYQEV
jgi:hypothetical protein